jgi:phytoene synthase
MGASIATLRDEQGVLTAARTICKRRHPEFYSATVFLPKAKRAAVCAAFAFCQMISEAVAPADEAVKGGGQGCCTPGGAEQRVAMVREYVEQICRGQFELPKPEFRTVEQRVIGAMMPIVARYEISQELLIEIATGYAAGASTPRFATWTSLERQCRQSAGATAVVFAAILGAQHSDTPQHARQLGVAMRLTRVLCNLKSDFDRGVVFLPVEDLARFRYAQRDLSESKVNENFRKLMAFEIDRARQLFHDASTGIPWLADDGSRLMVATIIATQLRLLDAIERRGYDVFTRQPTLSMAQKLRCLPTAVRMVRRVKG